MSENLKYEFIDHKKNGILRDTYHSLMELGEAYEEDIGGIDMGFGSMLVLSNYLFFIRNEEDKPVGFMLGSQCFSDQFENEKSFCLTATYLVPEYRNKTGKHQDVLKNSLEKLVNALDENEFDRLNVIPDGFGAQGIVTEIGREHVLKSFYYLLHERAMKSIEGKDEEYVNENFPLINAGSNPIFGSEFNPVWLFNPKEFMEKAKNSEEKATA